MADHRPRPPLSPTAVAPINPTDDIDDPIPPAHTPRHHHRQHHHSSGNATIATQQQPPLYAHYDETPNRPSRTSSGSLSALFSWGSSPPSGPTPPVISTTTMAAMAGTRPGASPTTPSIRKGPRRAASTPNFVASPASAAAKRNAPPSPLESRAAKRGRGSGDGTTASAAPSSQGMVRIRRASSALAVPAPEPLAPVLRLDPALVSRLHLAAQHARKSGSGSAGGAGSVVPRPLPPPIAPSSFSSSSSSATVRAGNGNVGAENIDPAATIRPASSPDYFADDPIGDDDDDEAWSAIVAAIPVLELAAPPPPPPPPPLMARASEQLLNSDDALFSDDDDDFFDAAMAALPDTLNGSFGSSTVPLPPLHVHRDSIAPAAAGEFTLPVPPRLPPPPPPPQETDPWRAYPSSQLPVRRYVIVATVPARDHVRVLVLPAQTTDADRTNDSTVVTGTVATGPISKSAAVATQVPTSLLLRDVWRSLELHAGDTINVIVTAFADTGNPSSHEDGGGLPRLVAPASATTLTASVQTPLVIDNTHHFVVVHPDTLVSGSNIAEASTCVRREVLKRRVVVGGGASRAAELGTLAHNVIQDLLAALSTDSNLLHGDPEHLQPLVADATAAALRTRAVELAATNVSSAQAYAWIDQVWARTDRALVDPLMRVSPGACPGVHIERVLDIEEAVAAPSFGIQGKLDGTILGSVPMEMTGLLRGNGVGGGGRTSWPVAQPAAAAPQRRVRGIMPFEIKSGKPRPLSHNAQVLMYAAALLDVYPREAVAPVGGVLYNAGATTPEGATSTTAGGGDGTEPPRRDAAAAITDAVSVVPLEHGTVRDLVMVRNQLACANRSSSASGSGLAAARPTPLPPMLGPTAAASTCARCFQRDTCLAVHASTEHGSAGSSGCGEELWEKAVGHWAPEHAAFLRKWLRLVDLEAAANADQSVPVWMRDMGIAVMGLMLARVAPVLSVAAPAGPAALSTTTNAAPPPPPKPPTKFHLYFESHVSTRVHPPHQQQRQFDGRPALRMNVGDRVVVSREHGPYELASGIVHSLDLDSGKVVVAVNRAFRGQPVRRSAGNTAASTTRYRIDSYEFDSHRTTASMRGNLVRMFLARESRLRDLVVDLVPPRVPTAPEPLLASLSELDIASLNPQQQRVVTHCTAPDQDYTLVVGMPGTGKSTTLAHVVKVLAQRGDRVLLASHTHSAVDTVLRKARGLGVGFVRLGAVSRVHPDIADAVLAGCATPEDVKLTWNAAKVVGVTCLGAATHPLLQQEIAAPVPPTKDAAAAADLVTDKDDVIVDVLDANDATKKPEPWFDVCIVDEASQISLPTALAPLALAKRFILVGDHHQLSPIVRSTEAHAGGYGTSLFERLLEAHPHAAVSLAVQYRMNQEIMALANALTYHGALVCGSDDVANQRLVVDPAALVGMPEWLRNVMTGPSVLFLDAPHCSEEVLGAAIASDGAAVVTEPNNNGPVGSDLGGILNPGQVVMVCDIVRAVAACTGTDPSEIGVITPYRAQLARIKAALLPPPSSPQPLLSMTAPSPLTLSAAPATTTGLERIEVSTIDQYQGRDKACIVVSLVRCNSGGQVGDLLRDWKRINVALTRARAKLILIGCARTLRHALLWNTFLDLADRNGWILRVDDNP